MGLTKADEGYSDWEGLFDRRRSGFERVRSLNSRFDSRGGEEWERQFHENFRGPSETFA